MSLHSSHSRATGLVDTCATTATPAAHTWKGMGRRRAAASSRTVLPSSSVAALLLHFTVFAALVSKVCSQCSVQQCSSQYKEDLDALDPGPYLEYCRALQRYQRCVDNISPGACRGDLTYHSTRTVINDLQRTHNCQRVLRGEIRPNPTTSRELTPSGSLSGNKNGNKNPGTGSSDPNNPHNRTPWYPWNISFSDGPDTEVSNRCRYRGRPDFRHCGLFGDPHLRTFEDVFQTCRVAGAWPLIYNNYLTAQVTNVPLVHGSGATATNKLTVIIKPHRDGECAEHKQYQAVAGNLPAVFSDGTVTSGREQGVVIVEVIPGEHVEIHIKYIATLIVIRQVGRYITFAVRMPQEFIHHYGAEEMQLCVRGCPPSEQIEYASFLSETARDDRNYKELRQGAIAKCRQARVIDDYLDSCVFDLLTTGDANFTRAAQSALTDITRLHPNASILLKNRTSVFENASFPGFTNVDGGAPPRTYFSHLLLFNLAMVLLSILTSSYTSSWCHIQR
ncbi:repulsive guidance molecule A-like isoform X2 [Diadema setosum]|uniref:repulsive guidance molecule A-like isoform X2 n=1 Tax=Diadema setosum TaxID=31175 RepID=UPI003B3A0C77